MSAVFKRELRAYFKGALGFVFLAVLFFFTSYYYFSYNLMGGVSDFSRLFDMLFSIVLFMVPILTMRLLSEDKHAKTDQILLTAPINRWGIILGKYLAALCVYLLGISSTLIIAGITACFVQPDWPVFLGNLLGLILLGCALIAICMFLSGLTESQVIAALLGFTVSFFLFMMDALSDAFQSVVIQRFFYYLSFVKRYTPFTYGLLDLSNTVFFVSIAALFLFLSILTLQKRQAG
ncbi:MAG: ABC transporter permease subunit [Clostridiales bacterium]|nr:ABC transporter permease subunit [Clostridiales bacterium]